MKYEFRGRNLTEAVHNALARKDARVENDNQVQTCKYVASEILKLGNTVERAVSDIESVSDDLKTRIDALGNQDKWAALKLVGAAATGATGVGGLYALALKFPRLTSAGAVLSALSDGYGTVDDIISAVDSVVPELQKIREGMEISEPRRRLKNAKIALHSAQLDIREWEKIYNQNQCSIVSSTFGRRY